MTPTRQEVELLMKRCQRGVGGRNALDEAHSIMADCYGTLGALMLEIERLRAENEALRADAERYRWLRDSEWDQSRHPSVWEAVTNECDYMDAAIDEARKT
jgi:hypothetical protein